jgi:hypothetical protein
VSFILPGTGRGTAGRRSVVEGVRGEHDGRCDTIRIRKDVRSRQSDHGVSMLLQIALSNLVARRAITHVVGYAINLHDQAGGRIVEIDDVMPDPMLPAEFQAGVTRSQPLPHQNLG